ncbi:hypothetical protein ACFQ1E_17255 [Sphingomonas canadensis]|uniref:LamG domain-containing protein n=1 Tax=Sphingomonas canadensis TaxID=1219257 RepID=A0ABW3HA19_9SPHN|nr:hypothetical protein [Sphingomonas canadensis]MCW3837795.1 hypothetical protein [Sphingomonas canadensis]
MTTATKLIPGAQSAGAFGKRKLWDAGLLVNSYLLAGWAPGYFATSGAAGDVVRQIDGRCPRLYLDWASGDTTAYNAARELVFAGRASMARIRWRSRADWHARDGTPQASGFPLGTGFGWTIGIKLPAAASLTSYTSTTLRMLTMGNQGVEDSPSGSPPMLCQLSMVTDGSGVVTTFRFRFRKNATSGADTTIDLTGGSLPALDTKHVFSIWADLSGNMLYVYVDGVLAGSTAIVTTGSSPISYVYMLYLSKALGFASGDTGCPMTWWAPLLFYSNQAALRAAEAHLVSQISA